MPDFATEVQSNNQGAPDAEPLVTVSDSSVHRCGDPATSHATARTSGISNWMAAVTLGTGVLAVSLPGCAIQQMDRFVGPEISLVDRPPEVLKTCSHLATVEQQLERLEEMRVNAVIIFWPMLAANSTLRGRYDRAVDCHRELCTKACAFRTQLLLDESTSDEQVQLIEDWAAKTERGLNSVFELIEYVKSHGGRWKPNWEAPAGYEFIKPINAKD
jgi:hypothetical protein